MGFTLNFEADQAVFDNLEAVTFVSTRRAGDVTVAVPDATVDWAGIREAAASGGAVQAGDAVFMIRGSLLAAVGGAKPGDRVVRADGTSFTVWPDAVPPGLSGVWRVTARNLVVAAGLRDLGTLLRPANAADAAGRRVPNLAAVADATDVPCKVQPADGRVEDVHGGPQIAGAYAAYLSRPVYPQLGDVWRVGDARYTVTGWHDPDRLDVLMRLDLEAVA